jgi:hypothetical protein
MKTWLLPIPDNDTLNAKLRFKLGYFPLLFFFLCNTCEW